MRTTYFALPVAIALVAAACHHPPAAVAVTPQAQPASDEDAMRAHTESLETANRAAEAARERAAAESAAATSRTADALRATLTTRIHFDYDRANLLPADAQTLDQKIPILIANAALRIQIAGNCDERGSDEYNIALGNRRAMAAREYLVDHGIDSSRVEIVSYGKERPLVDEHNDAAWSQNRRDDFVILTPTVVLRMP